ncbi:hypothetical protein L228DRAFT_278357 [Xylona heveae TC161]|uniref:Pheromone-regulated membrane protein n=1 Tax=Xylona heveae (strain CBS 132557 / TC161) TaxID=1328760 RepID=A0A165FMH8_XYLHT|nr:hypothetical protein L228DRAFT_278357 [Xylona heveae TC161]KZF21157.1 hypothetical protein L228DRAFT_278357 [Xylona heveae TC161]
MPCCGEREKLAEVREEHKWSYINLNDFRSSSCLAPFSYGLIYIGIIISIAVYAADTFTAVNLLAFNRWSGQIQPAIPLYISKWIFAACIIFSWVLLGFEWLRAIRVIRRDNVAESYLDPLAVILQSIRMGSTGRGWRRFLVFAELTKSKKGSEYVALFAYFSFKTWIRIVFAEGPRQFVNAVTLYSVMNAKFIPKGQNAPSNGHSPVIQFFINVETLAETEKLQAVTVFSMLFTLFIWVIAALSLFVAIVLYLIFLWHHIPAADHGLSGFCKRKIDSRLNKIVNAKAKKAIDKEEAKRKKEEAKAAAKADGPFGGPKRSPTLPNIEPEVNELKEIKPLQRQATDSSLPSYASRPSTGTGRTSPAPSDPTSFYGEKRPAGPFRSGTYASEMSNTSYDSDAPLLSSAGQMGYGPPGRAPSTRPYRGPDGANGPGPYPGAYSGGPRPPLERSLTGASQVPQRSMTPGGGLLPPGARRMPPPVRQNTMPAMLGGMPPGPGPNGRPPWAGPQGRQSPGPRPYPDPAELDGRRTAPPGIQRPQLPQAGPPRLNTAPGFLEGDDAGQNGDQTTFSPSQSRQGPGMPNPPYDPNGRRYADPLNRPPLPQPQGPPGPGAWPMGPPMRTNTAPPMSGVPQTWDTPQGRRTPGPPGAVPRGAFPRGPNFGPNPLIDPIQRSATAPMPRLQSPVYEAMPLQQHQRQPPPPQQQTAPVTTGVQRAASAASNGGGFVAFNPRVHNPPIADQNATSPLSPSGNGVEPVTPYPLHEPVLATIVEPEGEIEPQSEPEPEPSPTSHVVPPATRPPMNQFHYPSRGNSTSASRQQYLALPPRSGTAPPPSTSPYDDSIYDAYGSSDGGDEEYGPAPGPAPGPMPLPRRAATAGPGSGPGPGPMGMHPTPQPGGRMPYRAPSNPGAGYVPYNPYKPGPGNPY